MTEAKLDDRLVAGSHVEEEDEGDTFFDASDVVSADISSKDNIDNHGSKNETETESCDTAVENPASALNENQETPGTSKTRTVADEESEEDDGFVMPEMPSGSSTFEPINIQTRPPKEVWEEAVENHSPAPKDQFLDDDEDRYAEFIDEEGLKEAESNMSDEQKQESHERAMEIKKEANQLFGKAEYDDAILKYSACLKVLLPSFADDKAILYANRAACLMKLEKYTDAIKDCDIALEFNAKYVKAVHRRAVCLQKDEAMLDKALEDYKRLLELDPGNRAALKALMEIPPAIERRNEKLKEDMMGKMKDLGNMFLRPFGMSTDNFELVQQPGGGYSVRTKGAASN